MVSIARFTTLTSLSIKSEEYIMVMHIFSSGTIDFGITINFVGNMNHIHYMADYGHKINVSESSIEFLVEGLFSDINRISSTSTEHLPQYNLEN